MKTSVAIVGAGPAGLLLGHLLRASDAAPVVPPTDARGLVRAVPGIARCADVPTPT